MKKLIAAVIAATCILTTSACSEEQQENVSKFFESEGRAYGKTYPAEIGEKQENSFFSTVVNTVTFADTVGDYYLDSGLEFACVNITVKNTFSEEIPMGIGDFYIAWGEGEDERTGAEYAADLADDLYGYEFTLAKNEEHTGTLYFAIPIDVRDDLVFVYEEFYDDEFVGNTYKINLA